MNNLKKVGLTALAGSLVAFSAQAVEMAVSGSAKLTYINGHGTEVDGNPMGMNTSMAFSGSGEVNGYATNLTIVAADSVGGMSSAALSIDLADMGKITFDQGTGAGGISTIDDKTPTAAEEIWDGIDAVTDRTDGLVGGGNNGVIVYANAFAGYNFTSSFSKGNRAVNSDDASSGGTGGGSWDFALTTDSLMDGLSVGAGYGKIANGAATAAAGAPGDDTDEQMVAFANYTIGMVTLGYSEAVIDRGAGGGVNEIASAFGIAANLSDNLSISYGEREVEYAKASAAHVTQDNSGIALAYTMGSAKVTVQQNESDNNGGTQGTNDEQTQIALSLSF